MLVRPGRAELRENLQKDLEPAQRLIYSLLEHSLAQRGMSTMQCSCTLCNLQLGRHFRRTANPSQYDRLVFAVSATVMGQGCVK